MPTGIGNNSFIGVGEEVAYGTTVARTRFLLQNSESLQVTERRVESGSIYRRGRHANRNVQSQVEVGGDFSFNPQYSSQALMILLKHLLGTIASSQPDTTAAPTVYRHTFTPATALPTGLSIEVGKDILAALFAGCKVRSMTFRFTPGELVECSVSILGREKTRIDDSGLVYTEGKLMVATNTTVTWNGVAQSCKDFSITIENPLDPRYFLNSRYTSEPLRSGKVRVTGSFTIELEGSTLYSDFRNRTERALVLTATGDTIAGGIAFDNVFTMNVATLTEGNANASSEGIIYAPFSFEAFLNDANANEVSVRLTNEASGV